MRSVYKFFLSLYPVRVQREFGEEMLNVFDDAAAAAHRGGFAQYARFCARETAGLIANVMLREKFVKHKRTILQGSVAGLLLGAALGAAWADRPYTSTALIRVVPTRIPERFVGGQSDPDLNRMLPIVIQTVLARGNLWTVANTYDLYPDDRASTPAEEIIERIRKSVRIYLPDPESLRISFTYPEPARSQKVTWEITSRVLSEYTRERVTQLALTLQFLQDSAKAAGERLDKYLTRVRDATDAGEPIERIRLDAEIARRRYEDLSARVAEAEMLRELEKRQQGPVLELVQSPTLPADERPSIWLTAISGSVGGALIAWLISFVFSRRREAIAQA